MGREAMPGGTETAIGKDVLPLAPSHLTPVIPYRDVEAAAQWLASAFGFVTANTAVAANGKIRYIALRLGESVVLICPTQTLNRDPFMAAPSDMRGCNTQICYFCVPALDQHLAQARSAGAAIEIEPQQSTDDDGQSYLCRDPEGHAWSFGTLSYGTLRRQPRHVGRASPWLRSAVLLLAATLTCGGLFYAAADYRLAAKTTHLAVSAGAQSDHPQLHLDLAVERRRRIGLEQEIAALKLDLSDMQRLAAEAEEKLQSDYHARSALERKTQELSTALKDEQTAGAELRQLIERTRLATAQSPPTPPPNPPVAVSEAAPPPRLGEVQPEVAVQPPVMPTLAKPETKPAPPQHVAKTRFAAQLTMLRDETTIRRLFVELQRRHPAALSGKQPEIRRLVDDHSRTWFKLLAVPPQSKDQAGDVCAKLGSEGKALGCSIISY